ncbi:hypothetical protein O181_024041 [Austropuccinia psidii MF-1]|uniref:Uncharacterized protein n=1 Tax=Austropuccinia psidii MF-1 TaxID=1389203 RepID=A0A9Q3CKL5_9BASI|nr:hypothetical protein [Austropuccinia psidii MF-1]
MISTKLLLRGLITVLISILALTSHSLARNVVIWRGRGSGGNLPKPFTTQAICETSFASYADGNSECECQDNKYICLTSSCRINNEGTFPSFSSIHIEKQTIAGIHQTITIDIPSSRLPGFGSITLGKLVRWQRLRPASPSFLITDLFCVQPLSTIKSLLLLILLSQLGFIAPPIQVLDHCAVHVTPSDCYLYQHRNPPR